MCLHYKKNLTILDIYDFRLYSKNLLVRLNKVGMLRSLFSLFYAIGFLPLNVPPHANLMLPLLGFGLEKVC